MKNKKFIILIIALLLCIVGAIYLYINSNKNNNNEISKKELEIITLSDDSIQLTCAEDGNFGEGTVGGDNNPAIDPGKRVNCMFSVLNLSDKDLYIKNIELDYEILGDFETIEIEKMNFNYKAQDNNHIIFNLNSTIEATKTNDDGTTSTTGTPFFMLKFYVKGIPESDKVTLNLKNIILSNDNYLYNIKGFSQSYNVEKRSVYTYKFNDAHTEVVFYKDNNGYKEINKYKCAGECYEYAAQCFSYMDLTNGKIFLIDNKDAVFYDMEKGIIGKYSIPLYTIYDDGESNYKSKYFVGKQLNGSKYGIIDFNGNVIKDYIAEEYGIKLVCDISRESYSTKYNLISMKKDGKYGITKITSNEIKTDFKYDDIRIYNDKYYKAKLDDKWSLYSFEKNEKVIDEEYKQIFIPKDNILIVQIDNNLYIKDFNNKNLTDDKIEILSEYNEKACCGATHGISIYNDDNNDNIIHIDIDNGKAWDDGFVQYKYEFNTIKNELTKKDSQ